MHIALLAITYCLIAITFRGFVRLFENDFTYDLFAFLWGALGAILLSELCESFFYNVLCVGMDTITVWVAPLAEEFFKILFIGFLFRQIRYRTIASGLVYGGLIGLGFAFTENTVYILAGSAFLPRLLSGMLHLFETSLAGTIIAYGLLYHRQKAMYFIILAYVAAATCHISSNYLSLVGGVFHIPFFLIILVCIIAFILLVFVVHRTDMKIVAQGLMQIYNRQLISQKDYESVLVKIHKFPYFRCCNPIFLCSVKLAIISRYQKKNLLNFYSREILIKRIDLFRKSFGITQ
jgi:RsiW-degrading membrane proteinase PrsW (M82 family)